MNLANAHVKKTEEKNHHTICIFKIKPYYNSYTRFPKQPYQ